MDAAREDPVEAVGTGARARRAARSAGALSAGAPIRHLDRPGVPLRTEAMMAAAASRRALGSDAAFLGRHRVAALVLVVVMVAGVALRADRAVDASGDRGRRVSTDEKAYGRIAV